MISTCQLLGALLCVNPRQRLSANEALSFPYFTKSFVRGLYENKQILESDSKLHLLQHHVRTLQEGRAAVSMRVRRASLVEVSEFERVRLAIRFSEFQTVRETHSGINGKE